MVSVEDLATKHASVFENIIQKKNELYGYLGYNWFDDLEKLYDKGSSLSLRVYFVDMVYSTDIFWEPGQWTPDSYMDLLCLKSAAAALEFYSDGNIDFLLPEDLELNS